MARKTKFRGLNINILIRFRLKEHIRCGPNTGPYGVLIQYEQVQAILTDRFGPTSFHQTAYYRWLFGK